MLKLILTTVFFHFVFYAFGQTDSTQRRTRRIVPGYYSSGNMAYGDFSDLNKAIAAAGYPTINDAFRGASFGLSFRSRDKNSYTAMAFSYYFSNPSPLYDNSRIKDTRISMFEFSVINNFDLAPHPKWLLYPYIGVGFGTTNLTLYDDVNNQKSFASSISNLNLPSSKEWSSPYVFLDAGFGVERKLRLWVYDFYLGGSGGYRLSTTAKLRENYQNYNDAPSVQLSGLRWNFKIRFEMWRYPKSKA